MKKGEEEVLTDRTLMFRKMQNFFFPMDGSLKGVLDTATSTHSYMCNNNHNLDIKTDFFVLINGWINAQL